MPQVHLKSAGANRLHRTVAGWSLFAALIGIFGCNPSDRPPPGSSPSEAHTSPSEAHTSSSEARSSPSEAHASPSKARSADDSQPPAAPVAAASRALTRGDADSAEALIRTHLLEHPQDARALEVAGDIATRRGDVSTSAELYQAAVDSRQSAGPVLSDKLTQALVRSGRLFDAVSTLQQSLAQHPRPVQARQNLIGLATTVGLRQAARPAFQWLVQRGYIDSQSLVALADPSRIEPEPETCRQLLERFPDNVKPQFSLAQLDAIGLNWAGVRKRLQPVLERHPDFLAAHALYARALLELNALDELHRWQRQAPPGLATSPQYWTVAGMWAQRRGRHRQAARAFWEALRRDDAAAPEALTRLASSLNQCGRERAAQQVVDRIAKRGAMQDALETYIERESRSQRAAMRVAETMMDLGRVWESEAWARLATSLPEEPLTDVRQRYMAIRSKLTEQSPWRIPGTSLPERLDLSDLPLVDWAPESSSQSLSPRLASGQIHFQDQAQQRGWIHTCKTASAAGQNEHWIHRSLGGGIGVIDFDLDGWPDLAAACLDGTPQRSNSSPNRLFRNLNGQFSEVGSAASYRDTGFSHGITVGDFNDDGFPDILDANFGPNRLYRNNGDGTFQEISSQAGLRGNLWTTSAVMADINGDGFADLYEVQYCAGQEPYQRPCRNRHGITACPPLDFPAEKDRLWQGVGNGTFVEVTDLWTAPPSAGRGLGIMAGSFDERAGLDLYVANDMTANHLWSGKASGDRFRLEELGAVRGLGFNERAVSQASMGMAAADPDSDGDIDFFLTHFADEYNTYYEQVSPGLWSDQTHEVDLAKPSIDQLGFGAQWTDCDNNGTLELIVTNGHLTRVGRDDVPYRMPPQLFQRRPDGSWTEMARDELGDYFANDHLGRALVTLDADRDGRSDVAISHLDDPVALLINRSQSSGRSIGLELKSVRGQRDAIGATVTMTVGTRAVAAQLTAGDGYMCSSQRRLNFGTGQAIRVKDVVVTWPSGRQQEFGELASGRDYLLVEGRKQADLLHRHP